MTEVIAVKETDHRGRAFARPALVPSSFRGLPEVMGPLNEYMFERRRTLNNQLAIIVENALAHKVRVKSQAMDVLVGKSQEGLPLASNTMPRSFRIEEDQLYAMRVTAKECGVGLSDWINMAIHFCLKNDLMEPESK